jgi:tetratricopeptide (TPR) repeat protein
MLLLGLAMCTGCGPGTAALAAFAIGSGFGLLFVSQRRAELALHQAETLRRALESGQQRSIEQSLRRRLAMSEEGGVSPERQWLARAQLGGLLVAEWRLEEASEIYAADDADAPPILRALATFGRHEIATLSATPSQDLLDQIRGDKRDRLTTVPAPFRGQAAVVWDALEGLCLARMRRFHEAIPLLRSGVDQVLDLTPARIVYIYHLAQSYERVGELSEAHRYYELASLASPGTRLASEASSRRLALGPAGERSGFRGMLPEAPEAFEPVAINSTRPQDSASDAAAVHTGETDESSDHDLSLSRSANDDARTRAAAVEAVAQREESETLPDSDAITATAQDRKSKPDT